MRFDNFVVGPSNSSAFSVARSLTANPADAENLLILCGQGGTGKTHLLNAIGNEVLDLSPETRVRYLSAGSFSRELAEATEHGVVGQYMDSLAQSHVLLIDDLHLVEGRSWALERLIALVRRSQESGAGVVATWCSPSPRTKPTAPSLQVLFRAARLCYLWPADGRTKTRIVQKELEDTGLSVPARMVSLLALADTGDIRVLKGLVRNIVARAHLCGESVNRSLVEGVLAKLADGRSHHSPPL
jgi:chromosomal replication initiator protein